MPNTVHNVKWDQIWPDGARGVPPVQGGQIVMDRRAFWRELSMAHFMNQHSDHYYQHMYGDQDGWRVAIAATRLAIKHLGKASWEEIAFACRLQGKPIVVHRCQGKLFCGHDVKFSHRLPRESEVMRLFAEYY